MATNPIINALTLLTGNSGVAEQAAENEAKPAANAVSAVESATTAVPDFLSRLTSGALWVRVGEVLVGLLLIAVGVARLTDAVPIATTIAKAVK
jgi:hypothetical protein